MKNNTDINETTQMKIEIRKTTNDDAYEFLTLKNEVWKATCANIFPQEIFDQADALLQKRIDGFEKNTELNTNGNVSFVATFDGEIIGIANGTILSPYEHYEKQNYSDLCAIYIKPQYQKQGLGRRFFDLITAELKNQGSKTCVIGVLEKNHNARKAYEKWGGILDSYQRHYEKLGKPYAEVFYLFNL